ncbi:MAG: DUF6644 family protein [Betaproteobacteria bacterium]
MTTAIHALENSGLGRTLRESLWAYPITETLHIIGLAALYGSVLVVDLRLLGLNRTLPVSRLARHALPWTIGAFFLVMLTGLLMFTAHVEDFLTNRVFILKMGLIGTAGVNAALLHTGVMRTVAAWDINVVPPVRVRMAALLSILLWTFVIACGRLLAYT